MKLRRLTHVLALAGLAALLTASVACTPILASEAGKKNTAIGLTAGSIYLLARDKDTLGLATGAGAAYAWHQYNRERSERVRRQAYTAGRRSAASGNRRYAIPGRTNASASSATRASAARPAATSVDRAFMGRLATGAHSTGGFAPGIPAAAVPVVPLVSLAATESAAGNTLAAPTAEQATSSGGPRWLVGVSGFALGLLAALVAMGMDWGRLATAGRSWRRGSARSGRSTGQPAH